MIFALALSSRKLPILYLVADPDEKSEHGANKNTEKKDGDEYDGERAGVRIFGLSTKVNRDRIAVEKKDITHRCCHKGRVDKQSDSTCRHNWSLVRSPQIQTDARKGLCEFGQTVHRMLSWSKR